MHDLKFIRTDPQAFDAGMSKRGLPPQSPQILMLDEQKRKLQTELQQLQSDKNKAAREIGQAKAKGDGALFKQLMDNQSHERDREKMIEDTLAHKEEELTALLSRLPNIPADDVPVGSEEEANRIIRTWGEKPAFAFKPKEHFELGEALGLMDFNSAAKLSGARFVVLKGALARLERALANFFLDHHTQEFGYTEVIAPYLVRDEALYGTGQLPKFAEDQFKTTNGYWLIPTSEVPLTNLVANEILDEAQLPLRYVAYTPCFRSEAGSAGRDTRGMIRQHQFSKVEMVSITTPETSEAEHQRMVASEEALMQKLGLPYQLVLLSSEAGFTNHKTYDIEVWLPGQGAYREISSCSNCGAFQSRRMKARFKAKGAKETQFVHTLNGSGLPIGRTMVAILENYQQADGSVALPAALIPYMNGVEKIG